jgi:hypothetical protein
MYHERQAMEARERVRASQYERIRGIMSVVRGGLRFACVCLEEGRGEVRAKKERGDLRLGGAM